MGLGGGEVGSARRESRRSFLLCLCRRFWATVKVSKVFRRGAYGSLAYFVIRAVPIVGCKRWPYRHQHDLHSQSTIRTLYTQPEHSQDTSTCNSKVGKVVAEARANNDTERCMKVSTNCAVENHRDSDTESPNSHNGNSIPPGQTDLDD